MRFGHKIPHYASSLHTKHIAELLQTCIANQTHHLHLQPIHARSIAAGLQSDLFTNNLLLNGYSKSGRLEDAQKLFNRMSQKNLISWSSMVSMYSQHDRSEEAISLFLCFRRLSSKNPNEFILASVLRACVQSLDVNFAAQVHDLVLKAGFASDLYVGTALINFYTKIGCMDDAMSIFGELSIKNSVTWTAIITGYSQIGRSWTSLELFNEMREMGIQLDRFVLSSVISACSAENFHEGGRQLHAYAFRSGTEMDVSVNNVLIDLYCKCSKVSVARRLFNWMSVKNLVTWTTMIAGYMQNSWDSESMALFLEMVRLGWQADAFACTSILNSCGSLAALHQGKQIHGYVIKSNLEHDDYVKNGLLDMYAKCSCLDDARFFFYTMSDHDVVSYNAMIEGYAKHDNLVEAFSLFNLMRSRKVIPSLLTFVSLLSVSASSSAVNLSKQIHNLMIKVGVALDTFAGSALVDVYSKCLFVEDARTIFNELDERDLVVWNAMIFGYVQNAQGEEAIKLFNQLQVTGLPPSEFTFVALVTVASNLASLFLGLEFHTKIIKAGVEVDPHVSNALIDMYAKCGCVEEAWRLFDATRGRDVMSWNSMISRYAQHGHAMESLKVFQLMIDEEIYPNYVTFVGVLSACSHAGLIEEGLAYFHSMREKFGVEPGTEHYVSIVTLLGRAGKLAETKEFIESMPIEPAAAVWRSFLSACQAAGNVEFATYAAEMAISVDPRDAGPYILLSNIFASKGMWDDVQKIRNEMECSGAVKKPGYSWE